MQNCRKPAVQAAMVGASAVMVPIPRVRRNLTIAACRGVAAMMTAEITMMYSGMHHFGTFSALNVVFLF